MSATVAILATLDTKGEEADYVRRQVEALGGTTHLIDIGVVGSPLVEADVSRQEVAAAGGTPLAVLLEDPTRDTASPVMVAGATKILLELLGADRIQAVLGLGGTQGTANCTGVMQALPYGFPKIMVSTVASGDTSAFVGIKDITMMFSVSDIMGVNRFTAKILANAAAAAYGMSLCEVRLTMPAGGKPLIAMTNLGLLTDGATKAVEYFHEAGYEVVVFHAVGSGGRAMEQLMKDGVIGAVFDYALGEIADELFDGFRAGGSERLTVAGSLGLPQVICPGGAEHIGLFVEPDVVPARYADHQHVFHNPVIFVPRLNREELQQVAEEICRRLRHTKGDAVFMIPLYGVSRYSIASGPLHNPEDDQAFFAALKAGLPAGMEVCEMETDAEDSVFVRQAVTRLVAMIEDEEPR